jgi:hypothetical protein
MRRSEWPAREEVKWSGLGEEEVVRILSLLRRHDMVFRGFLR